jgi:hypothetical protein
VDWWRKTRHIRAHRGIALDGADWKRIVAGFLLQSPWGMLSFYGNFCVAGFHTKSHVCDGGKMKPIIALACVAICVFAGCAYRAGVKQETLSTDYRGEIKYSAEDISPERAEWGILVYRLSRTIGPGCESQKMVQDYQAYVPYKIAPEMGNFVQGMTSLIILPVTLPLFALSGAEGRVLGEHLKVIANDLNIFQATPPDEAYLFNTPVQRKPLGEPRQTGWQPVKEDGTKRLEKTRVELRIDSLRFAAGEVTDEKGVVTFDIRKVIGNVSIPEGESFADVPAQLVVKGAAPSENLATIQMTTRISRKPPAP